jgi:hypothetical protein
MMPVVAKRFLRVSSLQKFLKTLWISSAFTVSPSPKSNCARNVASDAVHSTVVCGRILLASTEVGVIGWRKGWKIELLTLRSDERQERTSECGLCDRALLVDI